MTILEKAIKIIISNEGNYTSVNANDNGALSVGMCQWHGERARSLIKSFTKDLNTKGSALPKSEFHLITEAWNGTSWSKRILNREEQIFMRILLSFPESIKAQDKLAKKDVQSYINAVMKYDITDENSILFLADICNQGGTGAIKRIINDAFEAYGKHATLDNFMHTALNDKVFKNYKQRRYNVYKKLTGKNYFPAGEVYIHTVVKGETLSGIALRYNTTVKKLAIDNQIENIHRIDIGQKIKIIKEIKL